MAETRSLKRNLGCPGVKGLLPGSQLGLERLRALLGGGVSQRGLWVSSRVLCVAVSGC